MGGVTRAAWDRVRVVSWDVDGTLYDMARMRAEMRRRLVSRLLGVAAVLRAWRTLRAHMREAAAAREAGGRLDPPPPLWEGPAYRELVDRWIVPAVAAAGPRPDVPALLDAIAASGRRQVVLSDFRAVAKLEALGLADRFEAVFAGRDLGFLKPAPELFERVLAELGLEPHELLHVGDREDSDGAGAAAAGVPFLHVSDLAVLRGLVGQ